MSYICWRNAIVYLLKKTPLQSRCQVIFSSAKFGIRTFNKIYSKTSIIIKKFQVFRISNAFWSENTGNAVKFHSESEEFHCQNDVEKIAWESLTTHRFHLESQFGWKKLLSFSELMFNTSNKEHLIKKCSVYSEIESKWWNYPEKLRWLTSQYSILSRSLPFRQLLTPIFSPREPMSMASHWSTIFLFELCYWLKFYENTDLMNDCHDRLHFHIFIYYQVQLTRLVWPAITAKKTSRWATFSQICSRDCSERRRWEYW